MAGYAQLLDASGSVRVDVVLASDGSSVLTGKAMAGGQIVDATIAGDDTATKTYQAWLAAGGQLGAPAVDLRAYAAAARFAKETAGITVGTALIATDRESQGMISGMVGGLQLNPNLSAQFKTVGGAFVAIGADQIRKIGSAVLAHVQGCFTAEAQVVAGITAGTVKTTADVDAAFAAVTT